MKISGRVRIINYPGDYARIQDQEIIIVRNTNPDIVLCVNKISAIVAEVGSPLAHAAIIAREYRKPLILGAAGARRKFKNGQIITIDTARKTICSA